MTDQESGPPKQHSAPTSTSDLMGSAKTVAEAAQLACSQQTDKIDKAKVAGAAEDILEATKSYGKLDQNTGAGQYVDKAQGYLHKLHSSETAAEGGAEKEKVAAPDGGRDEKKEEPGGGGGGGVGDMLSAAKKGLGGFFG